MLDQIATNTTDISSLSSDTSTNTSIISTNTSSISTVSTDLSLLAKKIESNSGTALGVFSDTADVDKAGLKVSSTTAAQLQGGDNTRVSATQTSPGTVKLTVQSGASGSEQAVDAVANAMNGEIDPATLSGLIHDEWVAMWTVLALAVANVVLAIWRPRFRFGRSYLDDADSATAPDESAVD